MPEPSPSRPRPRWTRWLVSWLLLTALAVTLHLSFWTGDPKATPPGSSESLRRVFNLLYAPSAPISLALDFGLDIWGDRPFWHAIILHGLTWLLALAALFTLLRVRTILLAQAKPAPLANPSRRHLLFDAPAALLAASSGATLGAATCVTPWRLSTTRYTLRIPRLPEHLAGLRFVQLSDTHLGPRIPADYIRRVVAAALDLRPDFFLLTGDYVHNGSQYNPLAAELFRPLTSSPSPVIGVLGNHDWYGDGPDMNRRLVDLGVRMIDNDRVFIPARGRLADIDDGASLCIAGFGDLKTATVEPAKALGILADSTPRIVLSHNPDAAELEHVIDGPRIDHMISGHYHGGQVRLPLIGTLPFIRSPHGTKYFGGIVQGPAFPVLISRGIGMSIVPVRIGVPPELVEITLEPAPWSRNTNK